MPPRRTRASRAAEASTETVVPNPADNIVNQTAVDDIVDGTNGSTGSHIDSSVVPKENGAQVNGKAAQVSAAQKKREKRKQRKREGSVMSESETESVRTYKTFLRRRLLPQPLRSVESAPYPCSIHSANLISKPTTPNLLRFGKRCNDSVPTVTRNNSRTLRGKAKSTTLMTTTFPWLTMIWRIVA